VDVSSPCKHLGTGTVFVGRVIEKTPTEHVVAKGFSALGYSMRFKVEVSLVGQTGPEITIETGDGGGDCGMPLPVGQRVLISAGRGPDGKLWTGICNGNVLLPDSPESDKIIKQYMDLATTATIWGHVYQRKPVWHGEHVEDVEDNLGSNLVQGVVIRGESEKFSASTKTAADGSYQFEGLPDGKYTLTAQLPANVEYDHKYPGKGYEADISAGQCVEIPFKLEPTTRIQGRLVFPPRTKPKSLEVDAVPTHLIGLDRFAGTSARADESGRFELWPLPPGDYYIGVNINNSPKESPPFPATYYPGVANQGSATWVHVSDGEIKNLDIPLPVVAAPRAVHFVAIGLDGKPMRKINIQLEDLSHPAQAASHVDIDLDENGAGTVMVYSGYSYDLHGSQWLNSESHGCSKLVMIPAGTEPVNVRIVMDQGTDSCQIRKTDGLNK
jgi:hypothetical protein